MTRLPALLSLSGIIVIAGVLLSLNGCGGGTGSHPGNSPSVQHIVIIVQENRSPDNLFHDSVLISRGADIAQSGVNSKGKTIPLSPTSLAIDYDLNHNHSSFVAMYDGGKMDGADLIPFACVAGETVCTPPDAPPNPQFMYVNPAD